jgi:NAD(P)-dependent dehydrogenase (short-subunit alcohol dehydrogenase family)
MIKDEGGECSSFEADITREADCKAIADTCVQRYGRIDILHNNVGKSEGDRELSALPEENWREIMDLNLKGMYLACKYVLPVMRKQGGGVILNISSIASVCSWHTVAYSTSKAAVNGLTHHLALTNAEYGIRCNAILPGLLDTPMAIERRAREQKVDRSKIKEARDAQVPLGRKMGTAWDTAYAALFLASDEAKFITGVNLPVDGGQSARIG